MRDGKRDEASRLTLVLLNQSHGSPIVNPNEERPEGSLAELDDDLHEGADDLGLDQVGFLRKRWNREETRVSQQ